MALGVADGLSDPSLGPGQVAVETGEPTLLGGGRGPLVMEEVDRQHAGAGSSGDRLGNSVPHDAGPQLCKEVGWVAAGQHIQDGFEGGTAEVRIGGSPSHHCEEIVDRPG